MADEGPTNPPHLTDELISRGATELKSLCELRKKGWQDKALDNHFDLQRKGADSAGPNLSYTWFKRMKGALKEIDMTTNCVPRGTPLRFLDLGCCPGGFTSYILDKNTAATGLGISLQVSNGGHEFLLEEYHRPRFDLLSTDLTYYKLGNLRTSITGKKLRNIPLEIRSQTFDMALLDGHYLRTQAFSKPWDIHRLLISQIILGLQSVKKGGTIVIKLPKVERVSTAQLLYMLDTLSLTLTTYKPSSIHATRSSFYAVAKGLGQGNEAGKLPYFLDSLQKLWVELTAGGEEGPGKFMETKDLDFIISAEDLRGRDHLDRLVQLGSEVWGVQVHALQGWFSRKIGR